MTTLPEALVTDRGAARWTRGHPWIFRSDVSDAPTTPGLVAVLDKRGRALGTALHSPLSELRLRFLAKPGIVIDADWWEVRLRDSLARRARVDADAYRVVHGEGDGLPSLVVDRYADVVVAQLLSAGLETQRPMILDALQRVLEPRGILLRHDAGVRRREGLSEGVELVHGDVPQRVAVREGAVRWYAAPWDGQKTGAFLDQRPNREILGRAMSEGARALDCFAYHGSFALHLAARAREVVAVDISADALVRGAENAALNGFTNLVWTEGDAFEVLRSMERAGERFDAIALDPPAFAKNRGAIAGALRGYHEVNLRAMRLLAPGGLLLTASCSFHVGRSQFLEMLQHAAADSGRTLVLERVLGQGEDHPELVTVPETGYLKGALLRAR
jgi:23S rRNA (cytosine1962-C5)-methyltransferase